MSIHQLRSLVKPPKCSVEVPSESDWRRSESQLGIEFPEDYRQYIATYGSGLLAKWIRVTNPIARSSVDNFVENSAYIIEEIQDGLRELDQWDDFEYRFYPSE